MLKKLILVIFAVLILFNLTWAQVLKVNNKEVRDGDTLNIFFEDLDAGKINFSISETGVRKAEITFDKGRTWFEMEEDRDVFLYKYRPLSNEVIYPEFLFTVEGQGMRTYRPDIAINYSRQKPDQELEQLLEKMKTFYENEEKERFLSLFSYSYPDRVKFEQAIQNDFYNYRNIRMFYRIDTRAFDEDLKGSIWNVYWQRKSQDRNGNDLAETNANISMRFDKEGGNWLITGLRDNSIFGSSLLACVDLRVTSSDISGGYVGLDYVVSAVVRNLSSTSASNFKVRFRGIGGAGGVVFDDTTDVSSISANSQQTVNYTTPGVIPPFTVTVTADSTNVLSECDTSNNSASKSL